MRTYGTVVVCIVAGLSAAATFADVPGGGLAAMSLVYRAQQRRGRVYVG